MKSRRNCAPSRKAFARFFLCFCVLILVPKWSQGTWFIEPGAFYSLGTAEIEYPPISLKGPYRGLGFRMRVGRDFPLPFFFGALEWSYINPSFKPDQRGSSNTQGTGQGIGVVLGANISALPGLGFQGWFTYVPIASQNIEGKGGQSSFKAKSGNGYRIGLGKKSLFPMLYFSLEYFVESFSDIEINSQKVNGTKLTNKGLNLGCSLHF